MIVMLFSSSAEYHWDVDAEKRTGILLSAENCQLRIVSGAYLSESAHILVCMFVFISFWTHQVGKFFLRFVPRQEGDVSQCVQRK